MQRVLKRLACQGSVPHRATREQGYIALWLRDPNGTDVALYMPSARCSEQTALLPEELDVDTILAHIGLGHLLPLSLIDNGGTSNDRRDTTV